MVFNVVPVLFLLWFLFSLFIDFLAVFLLLLPEDDFLGFVQVV